MFAQAVASAINLELSLSKRRQTSSIMKEDIKFIEDLIIEKDKNLDVAFYVEGDAPDTPIPQSSVIRAVKDEIASSVSCSALY